jgi:hypothetical protein
MLATVNILGCIAATGIALLSLTVITRGTFPGIGILFIFFLGLLLLGPIGTAWAFLREEPDHPEEQ